MNMIALWWLRIVIRITTTIYHKQLYLGQNIFIVDYHPVANNPIPTSKTSIVPKEYVYSLPVYTLT